jgi:hypothetical protein
MNVIPANTSPKEPRMPARLATPRTSSRTARGQALVVMVGVMLLSIAMLAVIIDGGNVMTQQRATQTGSDSTAEAGAVVLAARPRPRCGVDLVHRGNPRPLARGIGQRVRGQHSAPDVDEPEREQGDDREHERELDQRLASSPLPCDLCDPRHGVTVIVDVQGTDELNARVWSLIL